MVPFASCFVAQSKEVTVAAGHSYVTTAHGQHDFSMIICHSTWLVQGLWLLSELHLGNDDSWKTQNNSIIWLDALLDRNLLQCRLISYNSSGAKEMQPTTCLEGVQLLTAPWMWWEKSCWQHCWLWWMSMAVGWWMCNRHLLVSARATSWTAAGMSLGWIQFSSAELGDSGGSECHASSWTGLRFSQTSCLVEHWKAAISGVTSGCWPTASSKHVLLVVTDEEKSCAQLESRRGRAV